MQTEIRIATKEKQRNREEFEITQINGNNRPHYGNKHCSQFQNLDNLFSQIDAIKLWIFLSVSGNHYRNMQIGEELLWSYHDPKKCA